MRRLFIVCDGSEAADKRIAQVLWNDLAIGVMRHAAVGYEKAVTYATGVRMEVVDDLICIFNGIWN